MTGPFRGFLAARRASVVTTVALVLPILFGAAAFAIDLGVVHNERRALQRAVDAAALAAASRLEAATDTARLVMAANRQADAELVVRRGRYEEDGGRPPEQRFAAGEEDANAVSVEASRAVPLFFARIFDRSTLRIAASARAAAKPLVSFGIGSRLVAADPVLLDAVTVPLLGSGFGLTLLDYRALASARTPLLPLLRGLAREAGLPSGARVGEVMDRPVALSALLSAAALELEGVGNAPGAAIARKAARAKAGAALRVVPGRLVDVGNLRDLRIDYPRRDLSARVSVLGLLSAALADRAIGNELQAKLSLPGLASVEAALLLGEGEAKGRQSTLGLPGAIVATAQARARLRAETAELPIISGAGLAIALELVAAGAEARVVSAKCAASPADREVTLAVRTGLARLSLGRSGGELSQARLGDDTGSAVLLSAPLLRIEAAASLTAGDRTERLVTFRGNEIGNAVKTVRSRGFVRSLLSSLFLETQLAGRVGPLGVSVPGAKLQALHGTLTALAGPLDSALDALLATSGIGLGEADIRVEDLVCSSPKLVG